MSVASSFTAPPGDSEWNGAEDFDPVETEGLSSEAPEVPAWGPWVCWAWRLLVLAVVAGGVLAFVRYVRVARSFSVRTFDVSGQSRLSREGVLRAGGLAPGMNVFDVDEDRVAARLQQHPWVAEAFVERVLPRGVRVTIVEHEPVALVYGASGFAPRDDAQGGSPSGRRVRVASSTGDLLDVDPAEVSDLPLITTAPMPAEARVLALRAASAVVVTYGHAAGQWARDRSLRLQEVHVGAEGKVELYLGDLPTWVRAGVGPYEDKFRRLVTLLKQLRKKRLTAAYVLVDHRLVPERITFKLADGPIGQ